MAKSVAYKWPDPFRSPSTTGTDDRRELYRFADPILVFDEQIEQIRPLTIPYALTGLQCHLNLTVRFLENEQSTCVRCPDKHQANVIELQKQFLNLKILPTRRGIGNHAMMTEYCSSSLPTLERTDETSSPPETPKLPHLPPSCLPVQLMDCVKDISSASCRPVIFNDSSPAYFDANFINRLVVVQFMHNFTTITNCSVFFVWSHNDEIDNFQTQRIAIEFVQAAANNTDKQRHHEVSGNLGYLPGRPVIVGRMVPFNETVSSDATLLDYFHHNHSASSHHLRIPSFHRGECRLDNFTYETIDFERNLFVQCRIPLNSDDSNEGNGVVAADSNFTAVCMRFQRKIDSYLLHGMLRYENQTFHNVPKLSMYGNPMNDTGKWLDFDIDLMIIHDVDGDDETLVSGHLEDGDFTCQNMVLNVAYEFYYGIVHVGSVPKQRLLHGGRLMLGTKLDLKFRLDADDQMKVPIRLSVQFVDVTSIPSKAATFKLELINVVIFLILYIFYVIRSLVSIEYGCF